MLFVGERNRYLRLKLGAQAMSFTWVTPDEQLRGAVECTKVMPSSIRWMLDQLAGS